MKKIILITLISLGMMGCPHDQAAKGGKASISKTEETPVLVDNKPVGIKKTTTQVEVVQPQDALTPGIISFGPYPDSKDQTLIKIETGTSQDQATIKSVIAKADAAVRLLSPLIIIGAVLIIAGVITFIATKKIMWSAPITATGVAMIVGSVLLQQHSLLILIIGSVIILPIFGYLAYQYVVRHKGNIENIGLIQVLKQHLSEEDQDKIFYGRNPIVKTIQSKSTTKLVKDIKHRENL